VTSKVRLNGLDLKDFHAFEVAVIGALQGRDNLQIKSILAVDPVAGVRCKHLQFRGLAFLLGHAQIKGWD